VHSLFQAAMFAMLTMLSWSPPKLSLWIPMYMRALWIIQIQKEPLVFVWI